MNSDLVKVVFEEATGNTSLTELKLVHSKILSP